MRYVLLALLLAAFGCGAEPGDELSLGSDSQAWTAYRTAAYTYGSGNVAGNFQCTPGQGTSSACRFIKMSSNMQLPTVNITYTKAGFTAAQKTRIETVMNAAVAEMNHEMFSGSQQASFSFSSTAASPGDVNIVAGSFPNPNPPTVSIFLAYEQATWSGCTANLREVTSMSGTWQACDKAQISIDLNDVDAIDPTQCLGCSFNLTTRTKQILIHSVLNAIGLGSVLNGTTWRRSVFATENDAFLLSTDERCMIHHFFPGTGDGALFGDPGPLWDGSFPGC